MKSFSSLTTALAVLSGASALQVNWQQGTCASWSFEVYVDDVEQGWCYYIDPSSFPNSSPSGGVIQFTGLPAGKTLQVGKMDDNANGVDFCGVLVGQYDEDGCHYIDFGNGLSITSFTMTYSICTTGVDCADQSIPNVLIENMGDLVTVGGSSKKRSAEPDAMAAPKGSFHERRHQETTLAARQNPTADTSNCVNNAKCYAADGEGNQWTVAVCLNCVQDYAPPVRAGPTITCPTGSTPCPMQFTDSVTVTDEWGLDVGQLGSTVGYTHSIATSHGTTFGLSIPPGTTGFVQFEAQASIGSLVYVLQDLNFNKVTDPVCGGDNQVCGAGVGYTVTSDSDLDGRYSVVFAD